MCGAPYFVCLGPRVKSLEISDIGTSLTVLRTWQDFFTGVARMISTSIADVECKHALSKHWADRPFSTIVAKHINQEFGCLKRDAQQEALSHIQPQEHGSKRPEQSSTSGILVQAKERQIRKNQPTCSFVMIGLNPNKHCLERMVFATQHQKNSGESSKVSFPS